MQLLILLIWLSAISIIFYAFFRALTLTKKIPGGLVKQSWKLLYYLIGLLGVGYLTMPLFFEVAGDIEGLYRRSCFSGRGCLYFEGHQSLL